MNIFLPSLIKVGHFDNLFWSQFNRHSEDGLMSERDFSSGLLTYAGLPDSKKSRMIKRVRRKYKDEPKVGRDMYLSIFDSVFIVLLLEVLVPLTF